MDITIGLQNVTRELKFETDQTKSEVVETVKTALTNSTPLILTDKRGREFVISTQTLGYVEIDTETSPRVGFTV